MDVILTFSEQAIKSAIDRLAQTEAFRQKMRDAVKLVSERGYAAVDREQQDLALAVFLLAPADDISSVN